MEVSSSACMVLPDEILMDILLRLPVRLIIRLRLVCKSWRSLTYDPSFIEAYRRCGPKGTSILMKPNSYRISAGHLDLYHIDVHRRTKGIVRTICPTAVMAPLHLLRSCDGLFWFGEGASYRDSLRYHVCNLSMNEWTTIPCSPHLAEDVRYTFHLAMYYHWPSGEYRLLECLLDKECTATDFKIFSLGGSNPCWTWRLLTGLFADDVMASALKGSYPLQSAPALSVCGSMHWLPLNPLCHWIVAFDVDAEKFRKLSTPAGAERRYFLHAFEMKGSLGLSRVAPSDKTKMELWLLDDYKEELARLHTISLQSISRTLPYIDGMGTLQPLIIISDDKKNEVLFRGHLYIRRPEPAPSSFFPYKSGIYSFFIVYDLEGEQAKDLKFDRSFNQELLFDETCGKEMEDTSGIITTWTQPLAHLLS